MAYGGQILRSDGSYWMTPDNTPLNLVNRFDNTLPRTESVQYIDMGVSASRPCCIFTRMLTSTEGACFGGYLIQRNGTWQYQVNSMSMNASVRWYVFSNYVSTPLAYDIAYYDASGNSLWNGSSRPLQVFRQVSTVQQLTQYGSILNIGQGIAVFPAFSADDSLGDGIVGTYCYKTVGNDLYVDLAGIQINGTYIGYRNTVCFYIRTALYDL